jgi:hypothetical protein
MCWRSLSIVLLLGSQVAAAQSEAVPVVTATPQYGGPGRSALLRSVRDWVTFLAHDDTSNGAVSDSRSTSLRSRPTPDARTVIDRSRSMGSRSIDSERASGAAGRAKTEPSENRRGSITRSLRNAFHVDKSVSEPSDPVVRGRTQDDESHRAAASTSVVSKKPTPGLLGKIALRFKGTSGGTRETAAGDAPQVPNAVAASAAGTSRIASAVHERDLRPARVPSVPASETKGATRTHFVSDATEPRNAQAAVPLVLRQKPDGSADRLATRPASRPDRSLADSNSEPALLPPVLRSVEQRGANSVRRSYSDGVTYPRSIAEEDVGEAGFLNQHGATERFHAAVSAAPTERTASGSVSPTLENTSLVWYLAIGVLAMSAIVLVTTRSAPEGRRDPYPYGVSNAGDRSSWHYSAGAGTAPNTTVSSGRFIRTFTISFAIVGLLFVAIAFVVFGRGISDDRVELRRTGALISAVGQGILLVSLIAHAACKRRPAEPFTGPSVPIAPQPGPAQTAWSSMVPFLPLNVAWPLSQNGLLGWGGNSGQIAQLKAQLACLSQQLDHLGPSAQVGDPESRATHHGNGSAAGPAGGEPARGRANGSGAAERAG